MTLGRFTGFHDSDGEKIHIGDLVKMPTVCSPAHGEFTFWRVIERHGLPFLLYHHSTNGQVWMTGFRAKSLKEIYNTNSDFMARTDDWSSIVPREEICVAKGEE